MFERAGVAIDNRSVTPTVVSWRRRHGPTRLPVDRLVAIICI